MGKSAALGIPAASSWRKACAAGLLCGSDAASGSAVLIDSAGAARASMTARPAAPASQRCRTTSRPHRSQARLCVPAAPVPEKRAKRSRSSAGPHAARVTGSSVTEAAIATSGMSIVPTPMLRRKGTGSRMSDSRPIATVAPLSSTALPARSAAAPIAASLLRPRPRSSRHRTTTSSE